MACTSTSLPLLIVTRPSHLLNVEEHVDDHRPSRSTSKARHSKVGVSRSQRPLSRELRAAVLKNGSPDVKLVMTPENIMLLLENGSMVNAVCGTRVWIEHLKCQLHGQVVS